MSSALIQGSQKAPYNPTLDHDVAMQLARTEHERVVAIVEQLTPSQWTTATDYPSLKRPRDR